MQARSRHGAGSLPAARGASRGGGLAAENARLRERLAECEEVLRAIGSGEVDAFLVAHPAGDRIVTVEGGESAFRKLVEGMNEGAAILQDGGVVLYSNTMLASMVGEALESVMGSSLLHCFGNGDRKIVQKLLQRARAESRVCETTVLRPDGTRQPVRLSLSPMHFNGQPAICAVVTDLTERRRHEEHLRSLSLVDEMTRLFNRRGFLTLAAQQLRQARRQAADVLLVFADIDGLKSVNDRLGHDAGDRFIGEAACVLRGVFRDCDIVARFGGDEFAILALGTPRIDTARVVARIDEHVRRRNAEGGLPRPLSMSLGCVLRGAQDEAALADLLRRADAAMYAEKRRRHAATRADDGGSGDSADAVEQLSSRT